MRRSPETVLFFSYVGSGGRSWVITLGGRSLSLKMIRQTPLSTGLLLNSQGVYNLTMDEKPDWST